MPEDASLTVVEADDARWDEYNSLATRSYGHRVADIARLRPRADARVALRDGRVVAGGIGLLVPQYFGGQPVPSASLACGCVAPEERGSHLWVRMVDERLRPLQEQGAVLATAWSTSTGYGNRMGWAAPTQVFSWAVPTDELKRTFDETGFEITYGPTRPAHRMQRDLAALWNGPWQRPHWWESWQQDEHPDLTSYRFNLPGEEPAGLLSLAFDHHVPEGRQLVVHDFWAATSRAAAAMFAFLGRYNSRIPTVAFQRTGLPPVPTLLHNLHRAGSVTARTWHPWMLRILDLPQAVRLRGWPEDLDLTLPLDVVCETGAATQRYVLQITRGAAELAPTASEGGRSLTLTRRQFAIWYAGGYRTAAAAALAGVHGDPQEITQLVRATSDREPWLPEYF
ncbi:GNAT family N-acetyltransferase [Streptomyces sp. KLMMK]|uniref:GNAT family N-acetyltransferase n=1 Tax=Streptomyces sp. KLMMK TaxID=3109353 RepID=UPI002FFDE0C1